MVRNTQPYDSDDRTSEDSSLINLARRKFIQAISASVGIGAFGVGGTHSVGADEFDIEFADRRVREARKAWEKGFRGRPDRTLGVLSDGLESRHPDVGPWNGIRAIPKADEGLKLVHENLEVLDEVSNDKRFFAERRPIPQTTGDRHEYPFRGPKDVVRMIAHAKGPSVQSNGLKLLLETPDGNVIESFSGKESPHIGIEARIKPGKDYVLVIENTMRSISGNYFLEALYYADNSDGETDPFANVNPSNITADTPKVLGWYNEDYNTSNPHPEPWGGPHLEGNGAFIASIMAGSGRASVIDDNTVTKDAPQKVLVADEHIVYQVEAQSGTGVFGAAFGERIQIEIFGPEGENLGHDHNTTKDQTRSAHSELTVHDTGTKTYEVHVHPRRQTHSFSATSKSPARVQRVCVGAFKKPDTTVGDRCGGDPTFYAGIAPNAGLVGLSGWRKTRKDLQRLADNFAKRFNLRVLTISLGFGNDLGIAGGKLSNGSIEAYKALAEAGILTISRTMEQQPPAARDTAPAGADESIHVAKAGPWDGVIRKDLNQPAAIDEDKEGIYRKPDVTAPGSTTPSYNSPLLKHRITAAHQERVDNFQTEDEEEPIRGYGNWAEVSAQPPFVAGTAGLVAQALEENAPAEIALPPPEDAGFAETMRLKQTILATASETAYTAGPWHAALRKEPTYDFGGHDPIEGWGRVNIDAAVEAAARDLTPPSACGEGSRQGRPPKKTSIKESVGLNIPRDSRAVAGHISGRPGVYKVAVDFEDYSGKDKSQAGGPPHIDLFVYDAENPAQHGTPNVVTKAQGRVGSASAQFNTGQSTASTTNGKTYYVVAKLVNVPGAFNSFDIQARFDLSVKYLKSRSTTEA